MGCFLTVVIATMNNLWIGLTVKNLAGKEAAATCSSISCPLSNACSHFIICATPSINIFTSWVSDFPNRSALDTSQVPPVDAESTPDPRACSPILPHTALKSALLENKGIFTMQPARKPVPKLDGQVSIQPKCSECIKS